MEPIDWMETTCPRYWRVNGQEVTFDWITEEGTTSFCPKFDK